MDKNITVLWTSSSRPELLQHSFNYFNDYVISSEKIKHVLHEDYVYPDQSKQVVNWAKSVGMEVLENDPPIGLGKTTELMLPKIKTRYLFYMQDDWIFERPVDLDQVIWVMDNHPKINLIHFNKYKNNKKIDGFVQEEYHYNNIPLLIYHSWVFLPGVWRTGFVWEKWKSRGTRDRKPVAYFTHGLGTQQQRRGPNCYIYLVNNVGAYIWNKKFEGRYVRHIGEANRVEAWRRDAGKPGVEVNASGKVITQAKNAKNSMAQWLLEYFEEV